MRVTTRFRPESLNLVVTVTMRSPIGQADQIVTDTESQCAHAFVDRAPVCACVRRTGQDVRYACADVRLANRVGATDRAVILTQLCRLLKATMIILLVKTAHTPLQMAAPKASVRPFWGWLNAVFNKVDYERIKKVGPDRAASEWLLRCGAKVRYQGFDRWQQDYNGLPTGPLGRYKIEAIDATESCIMYRGFDHLDGLKYLEEIRFNKCVYIEDTCLERLSKIENLQCSLRKMELISCGNVTDRGIIALHKLRNLEHLFLKDLPGVKEKMTIRTLHTALPKLTIMEELL